MSDFEVWDFIIKWRCQSNTLQNFINAMLNQRDHSGQEKSVLIFLITLSFASYNILIHLSTQGLLKFPSFSSIKPKVLGATLISLAPGWAWKSKCFGYWFTCQLCQYDILASIKLTLPLKQQDLNFFQSWSRCELTDWSLSIRAGQWLGYKCIRPPPLLLRVSGLIGFKYSFQQGLTQIIMQRCVWLSPVLC